MNEQQLTGCPDESELEQINKLSRRSLSADEVYTFSVVLCDNEVDRDFERFSVQSLTELAALFVGKTGILDHSMKAADQSARIFCTELCSDNTRKTSAGETYTYLKARAYMVRTKGNDDLIAEIDGGIKKEVSVGCRVESIVCSVCGGNMSTHECDHMRGKKYHGKICAGILTQPTDAYEWSFVAVPAQREAGVTKAFISKEDNHLNGLDIIKSMTEDTVITAQQAKDIMLKLTELEQLADDGRKFKQELERQIEKYTLIALPKLAGFDVKQLCAGLGVEGLCSLRDSLLSQANEVLPAATQLKPQSAVRANNNTPFKI